jgi:hypothetical protein
VSKKAAGSYRILRGVSWPDGKGGYHHAEPSNKTRKDLPTEYVADWLDVGAIEPVDSEEEK